MIEQRKRSKTSSIRKRYEFMGHLSYSAFRPVVTTVRDGQIIGRLDRRDRIDQELWKDPPHTAFANLRLEPKALEAFIKTYGLLFDSDADPLYEYEKDDPMTPELNSEDSAREFCASISSIEWAQELLRRAWSGDILAKVDIEGQIVEGFEIETLDVECGHVSIKMVDLWKFVCFLFLLDEMNERLEKCANPECPAPFFVASRRTQRFCELGPCTEYAQRQYALKWWRDKGAKRRAKKGPKSTRRTKR